MDSLLPDHVANQIYFYIWLTKSKKINEEYHKFYGSSSSDDIFFIINDSHGHIYHKRLNWRYVGEDWWRTLIKDRHYIQLISSPGCVYDKNNERCVKLPKNY